MFRTKVVEEIKTHIVPIMR